MALQTIHNYNLSFSVMLLEVGASLKIPQQDLNARNRERN
jgi:hypothetical protein